jgi:hypothetical protein
MKYIKLKSLTWWGGFVPLCTGLYMATVHWHGDTATVAVINELTGNTPAVFLINAGLVAIGLRAAQPA